MIRRSLIAVLVALLFAPAALAQIGPAQSATLFVRFQPDEVGAHTARDQRSRPS